MLNEQKTPVIHNSSMPNELVYADDCDFVTEDINLRKLLTAKVAQILAEGNLKVNNSKTEQTVIKRGEKSTENWRNTVKLGSLLGDHEDILRRKMLAIAAMNNMNNIWVRNKKVGIEKRLKLYNTLVKPVLTYNASTWGMTKTDSESIDAFHRQQLRKIWKITWKDKISNNKLYEMSKAKPLSYEIAKSRWRLFGHILRLKSDTPAQKSMSYYFENHENRKKYRGRPRETIITTLEKDIKNANILDPVLMPLNKLNEYKDIENLQYIAKDRNVWRKIVLFIAENFYT